MSIDNISSNYYGGYYIPSQSEMSYLNYDINTTVGSLSTEYFDIVDTNSVPLPTWFNRITVYKSNNSNISAVSIDLSASVSNITSEETFQQILVISNETTNITLNVKIGSNMTVMAPSVALNFIYTKRSANDISLLAIGGVGGAIGPTGPTGADGLSITGPTGPSLSIQGSGTGSILLGDSGSVYYSDMFQVGTTGIIVSGDMVPSLDISYDLGSTGARWRDLYVGTGSVHIGDLVLSSTGMGLPLINGQAGAYTDSNNNIVFGNGAYTSGAMGSQNIAIGQGALANNTNGMQNVAIGRASLLTNIDGANNTAIGNNSLQATTTGYSNTSIGSQSLVQNTEGSYRISISLNKYQRK